MTLQPTTDRVAPVQGASAGLSSILIVVILPL
jgi:hypothetical protein